MGNRMSGHKTLRTSVDDQVATITLARPEVKNAFNDVMLGELLEVYGGYNADPSVRAVVITGEGDSFCAGADLNYMKKTATYTFEENYRDGLVISDVMELIHKLRKPTIARVNGYAIGGGAGLMAANDIVVASDQAVISLSEVKIGLVPACISPYVVMRAGPGACREFFLTGERMKADKAFRLGLVNTVAPHEELDAEIEKLTRRIKTSGPEALKVCKDLIDSVDEMPLEKAKEHTARVIAEVRASDEGVEGMTAFLEKRKPRWVEKKE
ncbi:MAG: enoyl-CoA hydratase/isomerase family protein [Candidatus Eisenbacteria bacterium]|nr:enoyl-CoA hydratase/isomerase family protein [Candidatus Eisenbacteria bacterium]